MAAEIQLIAREPDLGRQELCFFCGTACERATRGVRLADPDSGGPICRQCLESGPRRAAIRVRRRAARVRHLVRQAGQLSSPGLRLWMPDILCDHADCLDVLAAQLEAIPGWGAVRT